MLLFNWAYKPRMLSSVPYAFCSAKNHSNLKLHFNGLSMKTAVIKDDNNLLILVDKNPHCQSNFTERYVFFCKTSCFLKAQN